MPKGIRLIKWAILLLVGTVSVTAYRDAASEPTPGLDRAPAEQGTYP